MKIIKRVSQSSMASSLKLSSTLHPFLYRSSTRPHAVTKLYKELIDIRNYIVEIRFSVHKKSIMIFLRAQPMWAD